MIYLDNNATTRPSPAVAAAVAGAMREFWPNPSSVHRAGQAVRNQVELARKDVADLLGAKTKEITFTSGGTEAIDLAIRGVLGGAAIRAGFSEAGPARSAGLPKPPTIVSTKIEHAAVRDLLQELERAGAAQVRWAPIDRDGLVRLDELASLLDGAALASIQWANNETGAVQPVEQIAAVCRERRILFHCDGTQWVGKEDVGKRRRDEETKQEHSASISPSRSLPAAAGLFVSSPPCDLLTFSPHKFHGPKGVGVLWVRQGVRLRPAIYGTQEMGRRGGTENVPGILGAGIACREAAQWLSNPAERTRLAALRDRFEQLVLAAVPDAAINGPRTNRLWNTTNIGFPRLEAEALLLLLSERGLCASAGAACSSGSLDPSPVLLAMGVPEEIAHGSLRFSLSLETTPEEIDQAAQVVTAAVSQLRGSSASLSLGH